MNLTKDQKRRLQENLMGMSAGYTLFDDRLVVRFKELEMVFALIEVENTSVVRCYGCNDEIFGKPNYVGTNTFECDGKKVVTKNLPLCNDCGCPK